MVTDMTNREPWPAMHPDRLLPNHPRHQATCPNLALHRARTPATSRAVDEYGEIRQFLTKCRRTVQLDGRHKSLQGSPCGYLRSKAGISYQLCTAASGVPGGWPVEQSATELKRRTKDLPVEEVNWAR